MAQPYVHAQWGAQSGYGSWPLQQGGHPVGANGELHGGMDNPLTENPAYNRPLPARPSFEIQAAENSYAQSGRYGTDDLIAEGSMLREKTFEDRVKLGDIEEKETHHIAGVGFVLLALLVAGGMALGIWAVAVADIKPKTLQIPVVDLQSAASASG